MEYNANVWSAICRTTVMLSLLTICILLGPDKGIPVKVIIIVTQIRDIRQQRFIVFDQILVSLKSSIVVQSDLWRIIEWLLIPSILTARSSVTIIALQMPWIDSVINFNFVVYAFSFYEASLVDKTAE